MPVDPQAGMFTWQHIFAALLAGGGSALLGRHGLIQVRLLQNGGDRRRATEHQHDAECAQGFERAISQLEKGLERLAQVMREHNSDAGRRHESMIALLAAIKANTRRD